MPVIKINRGGELIKAVVPEFKPGQKVVPGAQEEVFALDKTGNQVDGVTRRDVVYKVPLWAQNNYLRPKV